MPVENIFKPNRFRKSLKDNLEKISRIAINKNKWSAIKLTWDDTFTCHRLDRAVVFYLWPIFCKCHPYCCYYFLMKLQKLAGKRRRSRSTFKWRLRRSIAFVPNSPQLHWKAFLYFCPMTIKFGTNFLIRLKVLVISLKTWSFYKFCCARLYVGQAH